MTEKIHPMQRPEVAAKQAASLRAHYARMRALWRSMHAQGDPVPEQPRPKRWTPEKRKEQSEKMRAYWARVRAGLDMLENSKHAD